MKLWNFLRSPLGSLAVFLAAIAIAGGMAYRDSAREKVRAAELTTVDSSPVPVGRESIVRDGQALKVPPVPSTRRAVRPAAAEVESEEEAQQPLALPISLFEATADTGSGLSKVYAPYGRLIPCETVITIESSKLDTPVIGLVTEDVWHDGRLVIPAGAEVHGRASLDRARERLAVSGKWVVVWRDGTALNGTELVLEGIALDRERDEASGEFGLRDGSAGLLGQLLKTDDWQEIKLFASTFFAGVASGMQQLQNQATPYGGVAQVPIASGRNAALQGTADVLNAYARQIQQAIARDGFFVRVPAGKQFYLYVTETIDQAKGVRGNSQEADMWRKKNET